MTSFLKATQPLEATKDYFPAVSLTGESQVTKSHNRTLQQVIWYVTYDPIESLSKTKLSETILVIFAFAPEGREGRSSPR